MSGVHVSASAGGSSVGFGLGGMAILRAYRSAAAFYPPPAGHLFVCRGRGQEDGFYLWAERKPSSARAALDRRLCQSGLTLDFGACRLWLPDNCVVEVFDFCHAHCLLCWPATDRKECSMGAELIVESVVVDDHIKGSTYVWR